MTSDQRNAFRDTLRNFIRAYKSEPCLWKLKSEQYRDRRKKDAAYNKLVAILKDIDPSSDRSKVVQKINALRSNFRKERKKVEQSLKYNSGSVYVPNLWYYTEMNFLYENPGRDYGTDEGQAHSELTDEEQEESLGNIKYEVSTNENGNTDDEMPEVPITQCNIVATSKRRSDYIFDKDVLSETEHKHTDDDRFELLGKTVAMKIRDLPKMQRLIAEKIINDTLFEAEMGNLTIKHKLVLQE